MKLNKIIIIGYQKKEVLKMNDYFLDKVLQLNAIGVLSTTQVNELVNTYSNVKTSMEKNKLIQMLENVSMEN